MDLNENPDQNILPCLRVPVNVLIKSIAAVLVVSSLIVYPSVQANCKKKVKTTKNS